MTAQQTRRSFLQATAAGIGYWVGARPAFSQPQSANDKLNVAVIGIGGQGKWNLNNLADLGENIVALCDVHESREDVGQSRSRFPKAAFHTDFRKLLDRKDIDAVLVATPDHTHALATVLALQAGKHVYCEKPLTHSVYEARLVSQTARRARVATQMGTQVHARTNYRRVVEVIHANAIGPINEVHVWVGRQWGGKDVPTDTPPVPEGLHYDLWLGPAQERPYHPEYLPGKWRAWWDFGGGTLADMGCHYMDLAHWSLGLWHPSTIEAEGPPIHPDSCPPELTVRYTHPSRGRQPPVNLTWYHGGRRPPHFERGELPEWGDGVLFVGSKGMLLADYNRYVLLPEKDFADFKPPEPYIPDSIGHHAEWVRACKTGRPTRCNFDYAGALTETVLLGNVSYRSGYKLEWDALRMRISNEPKAEVMLRRGYRKGWELPGRVVPGWVQAPSHGHAASA